MLANDCHKKDYTEYTTGEVKPEEIKSIYVPAIFKDRVAKYVSPETLKKIKFVEMKSNLSENELKIFSETCGISTEEWNPFLRGTREDKTVIDIHDIEYAIGE